MWKTRDFTNSHQPCEVEHNTRCMCSSDAFAIIHSTIKPDISHHHLTSTPYLSPIVFLTRILLQLQIIPPQFSDWIKCWNAVTRESGGRKRCYQLQNKYLPLYLKLVSIPLFISTLEYVGLREECACSEKFIVTHINCSRVNNRGWCRAFCMLDAGDECSRASRASGSREGMSDDFYLICDTIQEHFANSTSQQATAGAARRRRSEVRCPFSLYLLKIYDFVPRLAFSCLDPVGVRLAHNNMIIQRAQCGFGLANWGVGLISSRIIW